MSNWLRRILRLTFFENLGISLAVGFALAQTGLLFWAWAIFGGKPAGSAGLWLLLLVVLTAAHGTSLRAAGNLRILTRSFKPWAQTYVTLSFCCCVVAGAIALAGAGFVGTAAILGLGGPAPHLALSLLRSATTVAAAAAFGALAVGAATAGSPPRVNRLSLSLPRTLALPKPLSIIHLSDLHIGNGYSRERLRDLVQLVNAEQADLVAITGDIFDRDPAVVAAAAVELGQLRAKLGLYAVLGNHDAYTGKALVARALAEAAPSIRLLRGEVFRIDHAGPFCVCGIDDPGEDWSVTEAGTAALAALAEKLPPDLPSILLVHRPDVFPQAAEAGFHVVLAGHYHGGQIALPGSRGAINPARLVTQFFAGLHRCGDSVLHVSKGLGCTGPRLRLGCPPEITVIELS